MERPNGEETLQPTQHPHFNEGAMRAVDEFSDCSRNKTIERRDRATPHPKRQPKLRQLDDKDVDAVFAEGPGAINSLRDVQVRVAQIPGLHCSGVSVGPNVAFIYTKSLFVFNRIPFSNEWFPLVRRHVK